MAFDVDKFRGDLVRVVVPDGSVWYVPPAMQAYYAALKRAVIYDPADRPPVPSRSSCYHLGPVNLPITTANVQEWFPAPSVENPLAGDSGGNSSASGSTVPCNFCG